MAQDDPGDPPPQRRIDPDGPEAQRLRDKLAERSGKMLWVSVSLNVPEKLPFLDDIPKGPSKKERLAQAREGRTRISKPVQDQLIAQLQNYNVKIQRRSKNGPGITMLVDAEALEFLIRSPLVAHIQPDFELQPALDESVPLIGAATLHATETIQSEEDRSQNPQLDPVFVSGKDQVVVILDFGVDKNHDALKDALGATRVVDEACFSRHEENEDYGTEHQNLCGVYVEPYTEFDQLVSSFGSGTGMHCTVPDEDDCRHGTKMAGIVAGRNASDPAMMPSTASRQRELNYGFGP